MNLKSYLQMIAIDDSYDTLLGCFLNKYKHASKVIRNFKLIWYGSNNCWYLAYSRSLVSFYLISGAVEAKY